MRKAANESHPSAFSWARVCASYMLASLSHERWKWRVLQGQNRMMCSDFYYFVKDTLKWRWQLTCFYWECVVVRTQATGAGGHCHLNHTNTPAVWPPSILKGVYFLSFILKTAFTSQVPWKIPGDARYVLTIPKVVWEQLIENNSMMTFCVCVYRYL